MVCNNIMQYRKPTFNGAYCFCGQRFAFRYVYPLQAVYAGTSRPKHLKAAFILCWNGGGWTLNTVKSSKKFPICHFEEWLLLVYLNGRRTVAWVLVIFFFLPMADCARRSPSQFQGFRCSLPSDSCSWSRYRRPMYSEINWWRNGSDFYSIAGTALLWLCLFYFLQLTDLTHCLVLVGFSSIWILDLIGLWHIVCALKLPNLIWFNLV